MKKTIIYKLLIMVSLFLMTTTLNAQDFLLSQPWAAPTYVAPSFAGFNLGGRVFTTYRNQWSATKGSQTILAGYDQYFHQINSAFGATIAYTDYAGGMLAQTEFNIQYMYLVKISKKWYFRPGLQVGLFYRTIDPNKMVFIDQIIADGSIRPGTAFNPTITSLVRFDAAVSVMFSHENFFGGVNVDNLLGNNISFSDEPTTTQALKLSAYAAGIIPIVQGRGYNAPKDKITIAALYQWQGQYHQIDLDVMYHRQYFMCGIGYRGIPYLSPDGLTGTDALKITIGGAVEGFSLSYSYDVSLSSLVDVSGGSHEVALAYKFGDNRRRDVCQYFDF